MGFEYYPETIQDWLEIFNILERDPSKIDEIIPYLDEIQDPQIPYQLGLRLSNPELLQYIFERMDDNLLLRLLSDRSNPEIRQEIAKHFSSSVIRLNLFKKENDPTVKINLIIPILEHSDMLTKEDDNFIDVQSLLEQEKDGEIRALLISHLKMDDHHNLLKKIVFGDEFIQPRIAAARLIRDDLVLREILEKEQNGDVRLAAVKQLQDQEILTNLAKTDLYWKIRKEALSKLDNDQVLIFATTNDPSIEIRLYALDRIHDLDVISFIAMNSKNKILRKRAVEKIIQFHDIDTLLVIAQEEAEPDIRSLVIPHIDHQKILFDIALDTTISSIILLVIDQLDQPSYLVELFDHIKNLKLQRSIVSRLIKLQANSELEKLFDRSMGSIKSMIGQYINH